MNTAKFVQWIKRLQGADERVKRRWLIAGTTAVMVVVIGLWVGYMNAVVKPLASPAVSADKEIVSADRQIGDTAPEEPKENIITAFVRGVRVIALWIGRNVSYAAQGAQKVIQNLGLGGKEYTLQN
ncbi:hypothetical protein A2110_02665 [Candidatus Jorgensenbacteria bacterium GWA1_54_12]|uniref:Uncharacterized protein n=1 Tax=Candidatus Jorgensenbacteria bacterium GWA1_54_12 TaxID=1798468 RepID=A0A1F6BLR2_9BACT|nr:MAG: hypothetical protein A2110_02665 [Candidatus Jorgensenbacteria bacterium GWA1_54_12]